MRRSITVSLLLFFFQSNGQPGTIAHDGLTREYLLRLPSVYNGIDPLPLVIAMHGGLGSGPQLEVQSQLSVKAEESGFIVVYPSGVPNGVLQIRTWNAGWCCGNSAATNVDDTGFINALLDTLIASYAIDTARIHATGMSNGGFMSYRLACELSDRIASIAPVAASMSVPACSPARPVPVIAFHSLLDENVPHEGGVGSGLSGHYNNAQDSVMTAWAGYGQCVVLNDTLQDDGDLTMVEWRECDCGIVLKHYMTHDGGHSWPGGTTGSEFADPPSAVIDANDLMWEFFQQHPLECDGSTAIDAQVSNERHCHLFPNPAADRITVTGDRIVSVELISLQGRSLLAMRFPGSDQVQVHPIDLSSGIYLCRIVSLDGRTSIIRTVIE